MEHGLVGRGLDMGLRVHELDLKEVLSIVQEVSDEVYDKLFQGHALVNSQVLLQARDEGVHLIVDRGVVRYLSFYNCHLFWLTVLDAELQDSLAVFVNFFLESHLSHIEFVVL